MVRVFISSTLQDLKVEREAVERALWQMRDAGVGAVEYFGSLPETSREASLAELDRSDVYVGIFASRYGSGIAEAEFRRAVERQMPILLYLKRPDVPLQSDLVEPTEQGRRRLRALTRELEEHHTVSRFSNSQDLVTLVVAD